MRHKLAHIILAALVLGFCIYGIIWGGQGADWWVGADYGQETQYEQ